MMLQSSVCGMLVLTGGSEEDEPSVGTFQLLAAEAMMKNDADGSGAITYEEFVDWARSNVKVMEAVARLSAVAQRTTAQTGIEEEDSASDGEECSPSSLPGELGKPSRRTALADAVNTLATGKVESLLSLPPHAGPHNRRLHKVSQARLTGTASATSLPPSSPAGAAAAPPSRLSLDWIYGYNSSASRQNLHYLHRPEDEETAGKHGPAKFVYPAASVGVVYDKLSNTQAFYHGHTDEILSLAVHPAGTFVATGARGGAGAAVHVWNSGSLETAAVLSLHTVGVNLLAFSGDGSKLASVGTDKDHIVALWDWRSSKMLASGIGGDRNLLDVAFSGDGHTVCAVGDKTLLFFEVDRRALKAKKGVLTRIAKRQTFTAVAYVQETAFVGTASGEVYKFLNRRCVQTYQAHGVNEPVNSLSFCAGTGGLVSGGRDGLCIVWDRQMKMVGAPVDMAEDVGSQRVGPRGIITDSSVTAAVAAGDYLLIATRGGDIFEAKKSGADQYVRQILVSHAGSRLDCLAAHPRELVLASAGFDKTLRIWSVRRKCLVGMRVLPSAGTALGFMPREGESLCVGMDGGRVAVFDMDLKVDVAFQHCQRSITSVK